MRTRDGPMCRSELRERLVAIGIRTEGQALVHLLFAAVGRGVAVLGPMRAGEHAFAHTREWLGVAAAPLTGEARERALAELARRYLIGHGPATDGDLAKWVGLPLRDARAGLRSIGGELVELEDGLVDLAGRRQPSGPGGQLPPRVLPAFDPCLLGWRQREPFLQLADEPRATWSVRRQVGKISVRIDPFRPLQPAAAAALHAEIEDVARFEGRILVANPGPDTLR